MAAMDDSSDADNEGELVGCFGEEDNKDFWFMDDKINSPPSPTSTFDFIGSSDLCDDSGDLLDDNKSMLDLEDITDSSDDEEDNVPSLKSFSDNYEDEDDLYGDYKAPKKSVNIEGYDSMPKLILDYNNSEDDNSEVGDFSGKFLDGEGDRLVEDLGEDAFTRTFTCAMLANTGMIAEGVKTELYDSGALCHMTAYQDQLENFVLIMPKSIAAADKHYFQATGKGNLHIKIPNGKMTSSILLTDILYCPEMHLTLFSISKLVDAGFHSHFALHCRIFDKRKKVIGDIPWRNGLYRVDHSVETGGKIGGMAAKVVTIKELHWRMGHISPKATR